MAGGKPFKKKRIRIPVSVGVIGVGIVVGSVEVGKESGSGRAPWAALAAASGVLLLIVLILEVAASTSGGSAGRSSYGWFSIIFGEDGFLSTSKFQACLWTFGLAFALSYLGFLVAFGAKFETCPPPQPPESETAAPESETAAPAGGASQDCPVTAKAVFSEGGTSKDGDSDWDNYLILLGGPFAAAVLAKVSTSSKAADGTISVTAGDAATEEVKAEAGTAGAEGLAAPKAGDLLTDANGDLKLADTQYVVFNLVLFAYVVAQFVNKAAMGDFGLPAVPATLLALTGVSASGYVAGKATERNAASLSSAGYDPATGLLTLLGVNLRPTGDETEARAASRVIATEPDEIVAPQSISSTSIAAQLSPSRTTPFQVRAMVGKIATNEIIVTPA